MTCAVPGEAPGCALRSVRSSLEEASISSGVCNTKTGEPS